MDERAVGRADELGPAVVDVLAEGGGRVVDLAVDDEVHEVLELARRPRRAADEAELARRLLAALAEVALVEREAQLSVLEDEVLSGVVVAACLASVSMKVGGPGTSVVDPSRRDPTAVPCAVPNPERDVAASPHAARILASRRPREVSPVGSHDGIRPLGTGCRRSPEPPRGSARRRRCAAPSGRRGGRWPGGARTASRRWRSASRAPAARALARHRRRLRRGPGPRASSSARTSELGGLDAWSTTPA